MAAMLPRLAAILTVAGIGGVALWTAATSWRPAPARYPLQGVDLPAAPGAVEWRTVRARGADFAYLVATSGADRRDLAFQANWAAVPEAGLRRGAVHLYSMCQPAVAQANAFNTFVPRAGDALPAAIDVDFRADCLARPDRAALVRDLAQLAVTIEAHTGKPVLLRLSRGVERRYALSRALDRPIWTMANLFAPDYAARPWRMWRASDMRRIDGIEGPVNWDVVAP